MLFGKQKPGEDEETTFNQQSPKQLMLFGLVAIIIVVAINLVKKWLE